MSNDLPYIHACLSNADVMLAAIVGIMRHVQDHQRGYNDRNQADVDLADWQKDIEGALGELVVSRVLGIPWTGRIGTTGGGDVGPFGVRTRPKHEWDMIIQPWDDDNRPMICVTGLNGVYRIWGWIYAEEGKRDEWFIDRTGQGRHCYYVPKEHLSPNLLELFDTAAWWEWAGQRDANLDKLSEVAMLRLGKD